MELSQLKEEYKTKDINEIKRGVLKRNIIKAVIQDEQNLKEELSRKKSVWYCKH